LLTEDDVITLAPILLEEEEVIKHIPNSFPSLLIKNILKEREVLHLLDEIEHEEGSCSLWFNTSTGEIVEVSKADINLRVVMFFKFMGYEVSFFTPEGKEVELSDVSIWYKFIGGGEE
jgi:hypothetical protein